MSRWERETDIKPGFIRTTIGTNAGHLGVHVTINKGERRKHLKEDFGWDKPIIDLSHASAIRSESVADLISILIESEAEAVRLQALSESGYLDKMEAFHREMKAKKENENVLDS